jgi:uncharacterized membrane protein
MRTVRLATSRTFEQDPKYAIRLLVDVAIRALSPAIYDPTTAVQALDQIEDWLRQLGRRQLDAGYAGDSAGVVRVTFPCPTWQDYLTLSFDEIRQFGGSSVQVLRRLRAALVGLEDTISVTEAGTRPTFKLVTGVSTGALTAPFAFLGSSWDPQLTAVYTAVKPSTSSRCVA